MFCTSSGQFISFSPHPPFVSAHVSQTPLSLSPLLTQAQLVVEGHQYINLQHSQ